MQNLLEKSGVCENKSQYMTKKEKRKKKEKKLKPQIHIPASGAC